MQFEHFGAGQVPIARFRLPGGVVTMAHLECLFYFPVMPRADSVHIIGSRPSGGAERFYSRLVVALQERGHETLAVNQPGAAVSEQIGARAPPAR